MIGAAGGHAQATREAADLLLGFGAMTWPHLLARAMLAADSAQPAQRSAPDERGREAGFVVSAGTTIGAFLTGVAASSCLLFPAAARNVSRIYAHCARRW